MKKSFSIVMRSFLVLCAVLIAAPVWAATEETSYALNEEGKLVEVSPGGAKRVMAEEEFEIVEVGYGESGEKVSRYFLVDELDSPASNGTVGRLWIINDETGEPEILSFPEPIGGYFLNSACNLLLVDHGTGSVRTLTLMDLKSMKRVQDFTTVDAPLWLDDWRFVFTDVELNRAPRNRGTDFEGRCSVSVFQMIDGGVLDVVKQADAKHDYRLIGTADDEIEIEEESVKNPKDWSDPSKIRRREIKVPFPAAG